MKLKHLILACSVFATCTANAITYRQQETLDDMAKHTLTFVLCHEKGLLNRFDYELLIKLNIDILKRELNDEFTNELWKRTIDKFKKDRDFLKEINIDPNAMCNDVRAIAIRFRK